MNVNIIQHVHVYDRNTADVVKRLRSEISKNSQFDMIVRRSHVLADAQRRMDRMMFDPKKQLNVRIWAINACLSIMKY